MLVSSTGKVDAIAILYDPTWIYVVPFIRASTMHRWPLVSGNLMGPWEQERNAVFYPQAAKGAVFSHCLSRKRETEREEVGEGCTTAAESTLIWEEQGLHTSFFPSRFVQGHLPQMNIYSNSLKGIHRDMFEITMMVNTLSFQHCCKCLKA